ncbi:hypothetical protein CACET_c08180 [Clostridium aceticum]|uniref:Cyclic lactone autoinducer peptide n=1 Tax=Clostridium aceticum TaxID=84022 RepID=A0A0G3W8U3_9CLOT|nr:cyclic lactone autoinducer peptide [Clostridium aceticum]AKL94327.1 hypothetical protein CACET_c08180 [Clostridium aceticum]
MKAEKISFKRLTGILCNLLIFIAPLFISKVACFSFWGEPNCPDCLKEPAGPSID